MVAQPAPVPKVPQIKGVALERLFHFYRGRYGDERLQAIVASVPEPRRATLDLDHPSFGVLASNWYPALLVHALLDAMLKDLGPKDREALAEAGAEAVVRTNLRGIHKVLFQLFMTPQRYAERAQALWDRYFDTGIITKTIVSETHHESIVRDWSGHHPLLCDMNTISARIIYEELGCKNVKVERTACVGLGQRWCSMRITWG